MIAWGAHALRLGFASCLLASPLLGCGRGGAPKAEPGAEHDDDHAEQGRGHAHEQGAHTPAQPQDAARPTTIRIDPAMLRDLRITTQPAESRPAGESVLALGELRVNEDAYAEVGTAIAARVGRVLVGSGEVVQQGQRLIELESIEVGRSRAALAALRSRLQVTQTSLARRRALAADKIVAQGELQAAEAELAQLQNEERAAAEALSAAGATTGQGGRFVLTAPIAGTVIERNARRGAMVDGERPLLVISDLRRLWLVVHAFERDALRIRVGASAHVTFPALPAQVFVGAVTSVGSQVNPTSRTLDVRVEIDNPSGVLRPGMSGSAQIALGDSGQSVVAVPVEALQAKPQGWCVFIPSGEEGVFEARAVGRGRDLGGEVEVLSGLRPGEPVVVEGAFLLKAEADKGRGGGDHEHHH